LETQRQQSGATPVRKESEVADTHKSRRQDVEEKAPQEFLDGQAHQPLLILMCGVAPTEGDAALCQRDQSVIGDRHPMRVAAQVAQHVCGPAERTFAINDPIGAEQRTEPGGERLGCLEMSAITVKTQLSLGVEFTEALDEFAAEDAAENFYGQKEAGLCGDPLLAVGTQAAGRDDAVNMGMVQQLLIPGVQHTEEPDLRTQVFGIGGDLEQSLSAGTK
jgi:hypothetical protein